MAIPFFNSIDLNKNELLQARMHNLGAEPGSPVEGLFFWDTVAKAVKIYNGTDFESLGGGGGLANAFTAITDGSGTELADGSDTIEFRATGTGLSVAVGDDAGDIYVEYTIDPTAFSLTASQITDLATFVGAYSLSDFLNANADIDMGGYRITVLADPVSATDAATKGYVDAVATGLDVKKSVKVALAAQTTLPSGEGTFDGVALVAGDRVLLFALLNPVDNGIYVVTSSGAWTRATDADGNAELNPGCFVFVEQGTQADKGFVLTSDSVDVGVTQNLWTQFSKATATTASNLGSGAGVYKQISGVDIQLRSITAGSSKVTVTQNSNDVSVDVAESAMTLDNIGGTLGVAKGGTGAVNAAGAKTNLGFVTRYAAHVGDGSTTSIVVTHNLGTRDVTVQVYDNTTPYQQVIVDVRHTSTTTVTLVFAVAPTTDQYRVVVTG